MTDQRAHDKDFVRAWNEALAECGNLHALAERLGISYRAMLRRRRRVEARLGVTLLSPGSSADAERALMARKGVAPEFDMTHPVAPGFAVKGTSTLYGPEGQILQWVKTDQDRERMNAAMVAAVEAMSERIPREKPRPAPKHTSDDLLNCYVTTDYHVGSLSWPEETGEPWDTSIAERMLIDWFGAAIAQSPPAESAVLAQLGDFLHYDSLEAITPTSKHLLDVDSRFQRVVRVAIR